MRLLLIQHVACEGPGLLEDVLNGRGWELDSKCMDNPGMKLPANLQSYQALIILGGPMGAYEEARYPYLLQVQVLIREAALRGIPTLGICLGGQLIAQALGAKVASNAGKEIGWSHVRLTEAGLAHPLFAKLPPLLAVFQWHGDTFALPEGAVLLAAGDNCQNQAFVYQQNVFALQFHLEVTPMMIADWARYYGPELDLHGGPGAAASLVRNTEARWEGMREWREQFLLNLAEILQP